MLYYERKTIDPDLWGHVNAGSWSLHAHGDPQPLYPGFDNVNAPPGHPVWCAQQGVPVVRHNFLLDFKGENDNHPLTNQKDVLSVIGVGVTTPPQLTSASENLDKATRLSERIVVIPEDWEGSPDTHYRREVRNALSKRYQTWKNMEVQQPHYTQRRESLCSHLYPSSKSSDLRVERDPPTQWDYQPLGREGTDLYFTEFYANPYESHIGDVAFNPWNVNIADLRITVHHIQSAIKDIARYFLTPEAQQLIDRSFSHYDDTHHYFYYHCPYFQYLDPFVPSHVQGFTCHCLYYDRNSVVYPYPLRKPLPHRNTLLTSEEDEFLYHATYVFYAAELFDLVRSIQSLRASIPFLPHDIGILLDGGYLTPADQFDGEGAKYPLIWDGAPTQL